MLQDCHTVQQSHACRVNAAVCPPQLLLAHTVHYVLTSVMIVIYSTTDKYQQQDAQQCECMRLR
jgi:hypothetical protein